MSIEQKCKCKMPDANQHYCLARPEDVDFSCNCCHECQTDCLSDDIKADEAKEHKNESH